MRKIFTLAFLFITISVSSQKTSNDSIKNKSELEVNLLTKKIDSLKKELADIKKNAIEYNQTLEENIEFYKAKEDYFAAALSDQATRFGLIITGLLAILAFVSYGVFKFEIKQIQKNTKKQLTKQNEKFKEFTERVNLIDKDLKYSQANIFASIGLYFSGKKDYITAIKYHLRSAEYNGYYQKRILINKEIKKEEKDDHYQLVLNNLSIADDFLDEIKTQVEKDDLKEDLEYLNKILDEISDLDFDKLKLKVAEFRVKMNNAIN